MVAKIMPSTAKGTVIAPPSKSMAHRLLICAALAKGNSKIFNITASQDILATIDCLTALGAEINFTNDYILVHGIDRTAIKTPVNANCRESGSTLRFMIPIMLLTGTECRLYGSEYLFNRPLTVYEDICNRLGINFIKGKGECIVKGNLKSGEFVVPGNISSQFISGLLFALPLLDGDSKIIIQGEIESRSYISLTINALKSFGVSAYFKNNEIIIIGNQEYVPAELSVEGDYSNAAFLDAFNYLGGKVRIDGLNRHSNQGDKVYLDYFIQIKNGYPTLDITDCPDLAPILFTLAAFYNGAKFIGTKRLKMKESDRAVVMKEELSKFGADLIINENSVIVKNSNLYKPTSILNGHNDHRVVMSISVLLSHFGGEICGAQAVSKSYPDFFEKISSLGIGVTLNAE